MENEEVKALMRRASEHYRAKEFNAAIADYNAALKLSPNNAFIFYNRGVVWYSKRDKARAVADFEAAVRLAPDKENYQEMLKKSYGMPEAQNARFTVPLSAGVSAPEESYSKLDGTPFTAFAKPYLDFIGKGSLFAVIYIVMAIANLLIPFVIIYKAIDAGLFKFGDAKIIFAFVFSWLVIVFACWIGFQLWWNRRAKLSSFGDSDFIVTMMFSDIFQTFGEWIGTLIGIIGAGAGLIAGLMLGGYAGELFRAIGLGFLPSGLIVVVAGPLIGFLIMILSRFVAEQMRLLAALVHNTKCIANGIKDAKS